MAANIKLWEHNLVEFRSTTGGIAHFYDYIEGWDVQLDRLLYQSKDSFSVYWDVVTTLHPMELTCLDRSRYIADGEIYLKDLEGKRILHLTDIGWARIVS